MYKSMEENENPPASTQGMMNVDYLTFIQILTLAPCNSGGTDVLCHMTAHHQCRPAGYTFCNYVNFPFTYSKSGDSRSWNDHLVYQILIFSETVVWILDNYLCVWTFVDTPQRIKGTQRNGLRHGWRLLDKTILTQRSFTLTVYNSERKCAAKVYL